MFWLYGCPFLFSRAFRAVRPNGVRLPHDERTLNVLRHRKAREPAREARSVGVSTRV